MAQFADGVFNRPQVILANCLAEVLGRQCHSIQQKQRIMDCSKGQQTAAGGLLPVFSPLPCDLITALFFVSKQPPVHRIQVFVPNPATGVVGREKIDLDQRTRMHQKQQVGRISHVR